MHRHFRRFIIAVAFAGAAYPTYANAMTRTEPPGENGLPLTPVQTARTCRQVSSCREAVELWCGGYRRADADNDGIPCENVCRSKKEVDAIREEIGC